MNIDENYIFKCPHCFKGDKGETKLIFREEVVLYSRPKLSLLPDKEQVTWEVYGHYSEDVGDFWFECDNCGYSYTPRELDEMLKTGALKFTDE